jgi:hypothetical protein
MSDADNFTDNDSDRDSDFELGDSERDSDMTENYDAPVVDAGNPSSDSESGNTQDRPAETSVAPRAFANHKTSDLSRLSGQHYMDILPPTEPKKSPCSLQYALSAGNVEFVKKHVTCAEHVLLSLRSVFCRASGTTMLLPIISYDTVE